MGSGTQKIQKQQLLPDSALWHANKKYHKQKRKTTKNQQFFCDMHHVACATNKQSKTHTHESVLGLKYKYI